MFSVCFSIKHFIYFISVILIFTLAFHVAVLDLKTVFFMYFISVFANKCESFEFEEAMLLFITKVITLIPCSISIESFSENA